LKDRILRDGQVLTRILKWMVLHHQWMRRDGLVWKGIARGFANVVRDESLTAEISGMLPP